MIYIIGNVLMTNSFKQCFSAASTIVGNKLTNTITLNLFPNPLIKFIPSDNMCQVLNGKSSTAFILLSSPSKGNIQLPPTGAGISFVYLFNQNISITYQFANPTLYADTLDATFGGFNILLDGEYEVKASVADVFHTLSNQTACFSSTRFTYSLLDDWYSFEVQPLFCQVSSFTVFFEYQVSNSWFRVPVRPVEDINVNVKTDDYKTSNVQFATIKRYLLDMRSATESSKYTADEKAALLKLVQTLFSNVNTPVRLSLDYSVKTTTASITSLSSYVYSDNKLKCAASMTPKTTINDNGLIFKTGFNNAIPCLTIPNSDPNYALAQSILQKTTQVKLIALITSKQEPIKLYKTVSYQNFISLYLVQFSVEEQMKNQLLDNDSYSGAQIQLFVQLYDVNNKLQVDFSTIPVELKRTCVKQRVWHMYEKYTNVVVWTKQIPRCKQRPVVTANVQYTGLQKIGDQYHLVEQYVVPILANYSMVKINVPITCDKAVDPSICQTNRTKNMQTNVRDDIIYFVETASELAQMQYTVVETSMNIWTFFFASIGVLTVGIIGAVIYLVVKGNQ
ncbi:Conserved_hypothetical protein [Hexamita inflata]|uniref:Uncharacterized protein n=1 Tax=Hexamita inflata TaxID=28002 RepID=A0AA86N8N0_9EUKA|nr:Conserved hypothetical protein [Hexamita inflata]